MSTADEEPREQYIPGSASLVGEVDKRLLVVLRDGRTLIGYLRSVDQFANLLLQDTIERIHVGNQFGDIPRGIFIVRGENMVLCGEIDPELEQGLTLERVSIDDILEAQRLQQEEQEQERDRKAKILQEKGLPLTERADDVYS